MSDPSLLIPAIVAFGLLIVGLGITIREFYTERNIGKAPIDHEPHVVDPSPKQVVGGERS